jgi:hypothetical protein
MASKVVADEIRRAARWQTAQLLGLAPSMGGRLSSARAVDARIDNVFRLPTQEYTGGDLQDESGNLYFLDGYSDPDGDDLPVPP